METQKKIAEQENKFKLQVQEWIANNPQCYGDFCKQFNMMAEGDISFAEQNYDLFAKAIPKELMDVYNHIIMSMAKGVTDDHHAPDFYRKYEKFLEECKRDDNLVRIGLLDNTISKVTRDEVMPDEDMYAYFDYKHFDYSFDNVPMSINSYLNGCMRDAAIEESGNLTSEEDITDFIFHLRHIIKVTREKFYAYTFLMIPKFISNLEKLSRDNNHERAFCIYYFLVFDKGINKLIKMLGRMMANRNSTDFSLLMYETCVKKFIGFGAGSGLVTKESLAELAEETDNEVTKDAIYKELRHVKTRRGKKKKILLLDSLLIGDKTKIKQLVNEYMEANTSSISLGYLLYIIKVTHCIGECDYMTFHRAITFYIGKNMNEDVPQNAYNDMMTFPDDLKKSMEARWINARRVIEKWIPKFKEVNS